MSAGAPSDSGCGNKIKKLKVRRELGRVIYVRAPLRLRRMRGRGARSNWGHTPPGGECCKRLRESVKHSVLYSMKSVSVDCVCANVCRTKRVKGVFSISTLNDERISMF